MKIKMVYSLLFVTLLGSCDYNEMTDTETPASSSVEDVKCTDFGVNMETARFAAKFLSDKEIKDIKPIVYHSKDTVLYIVNYEDGWTLLSADMRAKAVIASSETGIFDESDSNSGSALWINNLANQVLDLKHDTIPVSYSELNNNEEYVFWHRMYLGYLAETRDNSEDKSFLRKTSMRRRPAPQETTGTKYYLCKKLVKIDNLSSTTQVIGNRLKTKWGQGNPYNVYVPKVYDNNKGEYVFAPVGCAAVAIGQILYYYHDKFGVPSSLKHGARYVGYNNDAIFQYKENVENSPRWEQMARFADYKQKPTDSTNYVAELFADLGFNLSMEYAFDGSVSESSVYRYVINQYGLNCDKGDFDASIVEQNIRNELPVIITSHAKKDVYDYHVIYSDGHSWIIDGISETTMIKQYSYLWVIAKLGEDNDRGRDGRNETTPPRSNHTELEPFGGAFMLDGVYTSMSDLRRNYEYVIEADLALSTGVVPRDGEIIETRKEIQKYFMMNWGVYGEHNNQKYSIKATNWEYSPYNFKYGTEIFYNFRKL